MMVLGKEHITGSLRYENKIVYQHPEYIWISKGRREKMDIRPRQPQAAATPSNLEGEKGSAAAACSSPKLGEVAVRPEECVKPLYQRVLETSKQWGNEENMMYVVGATKAEMLEDVRRIVPGSFLLVPGVGAQGGSLEEVCKHGLNKDCGLLVNSSRGIIYASNGMDFAERAAEEATKLQQQMAAVL